MGVHSRDTHIPRTWSGSARASQRLATPQPVGVIGEFLRGPEAVIEADAQLLHTHLRRQVDTQRHTVGLTRGRRRVACYAPRQVSNAQVYAHRKDCLPPAAVATHDARSGQHAGGDGEAGTLGQGTGGQRHRGGRSVGRCGAHGDSHTHCPLARVVSVGWPGWEALMKRLLSQVVSGVEFVWEQGQPASIFSWNWVTM